MSWTDERITLLQQLWSDGLSASQIASQLGGVTRNAVIGKVHRLGLSDKSRVKAGNHRAGQLAGAGASTPPAPAAKAEPASVTLLSEAREAKQAEAEKKDAAPAVVERIVESVAAESRAPLAVQSEPVVVASAPEKGSVGILELTEQTCRWPFGDPTKPGFHFCGAHSATGEVYCAEHAKVAFQRSRRAAGASRHQLTRRRSRRTHSRPRAPCGSGRPPRPC